MLRPFVALVLFVFAAYAPAAEPAPLTFTLTYDKAAFDGPFSGRVYVAFRTTNAPPSGLNWFAPEPGLAKDVTGWMPGDPLLLGPASMPFPAPLTLPEKGK